MKKGRKVVQLNETSYKAQPAFCQSFLVLNLNEKRKRVIVQNIIIHTVCPFRITCHRLKQASITDAFNQKDGRTHRHPDERKKKERKNERKKCVSLII
jgi:hypothetical protein